MNKLLEEIKLHCEAGSIQEHMDLFDRMEELIKVSGVNDEMELLACEYLEIGKDYYELK